MRLKKLFLLLLIFVSIINGYAIDKSSIKISKDVLKEVEFISHKGNGEFDTYLIMNINFSPVEKVYKTLNKRTKKDIKNRGEAHITVLTPVEYYRIIKPYLSIEDINDIALTSQIQKSKFEVLGIGRGQTEINGKLEQTYYILVESEELLNIRRKIFDQYVKNGGEPSKFDPENYYPHITLGFSKRDLHESDGIKKGYNSLYIPMDLK